MPLSLEDRFAILELLARACWAADAKDVDVYAAHFDPTEGHIEGAFEARPGADFRDDMRQIFKGEGSLKRHALLNRVIDDRGDHATVTWLMPVFEGESEPLLVATCRVTDELVRRAGGWRIRRHRVDIDPSMKADVGQRT